MTFIINAMASFGCHMDQWSNGNVNHRNTSPSFQSSLGKPHDININFIMVHRQGRLSRVMDEIASLSCLSCPGPNG